MTSRLTTRTPATIRGCAPEVAASILGERFFGHEKLARLAQVHEELLPHHGRDIPFPATMINRHDHIIMPSARTPVASLIKMAAFHHVSITLNMGQANCDVLLAQQTLETWHIINTCPTRSPHCYIKENGTWQTLNIADALQLGILGAANKQPPFFKTLYFFGQKPSPDQTKPTPVRAMFYLTMVGNEIEVSDPAHCFASVSETIQTIVAPTAWFQPIEIASGKTAVAA